MLMCQSRCKYNVKRTCIVVDSLTTIDFNESDYCVMHTKLRKKTIYYIAHSTLTQIIFFNFLVHTHINVTSSLLVTPSASSKFSLQSQASVKAINQSQHENEADNLSTSEPRPEQETTASAQAEPLSEGQATPEGESTSEPEGDSGKSEPYTQPETWPEPGPEWKTAFKKWKAAWHIHVYLFATAFLVIGSYAGYYVVLNIYDGLGSKYLSVCLNAMVLLFGLTRAFVLFLDPYHQGDLINALFVMRLLWSIGGPCLTASDCLIIMALVETSRVSIAPPTFQKLGTVSTVIGIHFVLVIVSDTIVSMYMEAKVMILMCQIFFSVWGITLGAGYANLAYKLDKKLFSHKQVKDKGDKIYIFLIYASAGANFFICGVMIYTMIGVFGVYSDITFVDAWHWWTLQTLFRTGEVITCVLIFTVSAKRTRVKIAADELNSEFDSQSQAFDSSSGCSAFQILQTCVNRIRNRNRVSNANVVSDETNNATTTGTSDDDDTLPPVFEAFQAKGRGRRTSLFSHMQEASIQNRISQLEDSPAVVPSSRTRSRRQSLFSAMHEASINNAISNFASALTQANTNVVACESLESEEDPPGGQPVPFPRRGRRANVFSTVQETKPDKVISRSAKMEDIKEESVYESESESVRRPPFLKRRSSERLRQLFLNLLPSKDVGSEPKNIVEEDEPVESEVNSVDSSSIPVETS